MAQSSPTRHVLASGPVNSGQVKVELVTPTGKPPFVVVTWPLKPSAMWPRGVQRRRAGRRQLHRLRPPAASAAVGPRGVTPDHRRRQLRPSGIAVADSPAGALLSPLLQASELARQLGDLGGRVFDGRHGAVVRDPDGPGLESGSSRSARTDALVSEQAVFIDRCALTEMPVDKIIIERHPSKIDKDGRHDYLIAPSRTKILGKRLSDSRQCTRLGSRSSPESERVADYSRPRSNGGA